MLCLDRVCPLTTLHPARQSSALCPFPRPWICIHIVRPPARPLPSPQLPPQTFSTSTLSTSRRRSTHGPSPNPTRELERIASKNVINHVVGMGSMTQDAAVILRNVPKTRMVHGTPYQPEVAQGRPNAS